MRLLYNLWPLRQILMAFPQMSRKSESFRELWYQGRLPGGGEFERVLSKMNNRIEGRNSSSVGSLCERKDKEY